MINIHSLQASKTKTTIPGVRREHVKGTTLSVFETIIIE